MIQKQKSSFFFSSCIHPLVEPIYPLKIEHLNCPQEHWQNITKNNIQKAIELALKRVRERERCRHGEGVKRYKESERELNYLVFEQFSVIYSCTFMDAK